MAFFVVDVKRRYNLLLGRDWIHSNGCVTSTLHQCILQWIGDDVEVVVIPRSEIAGTKPPYVCPGCFTHTYSNNMINRFYVQ
jgi:hypothetical protein